MKCEKCQQELPEGVLKCPNCAIEETIEEEAVAVDGPLEANDENDGPFFKYFKSIKGMSIVAGSIIILLLTVGLVSAGGGNVEYVVKKHAFTMVDDEEWFYVDIEKSDYAIEEIDDYMSGEFSLDRNCYAYIDDNQTLFVYGKEGFVEIEDDVDVFSISLDGSTIAYATETDDYEAELYAYNVSSQESIEISDEAYVAGSSPITISVDGKYVGYMAEYDEGDNDFEGYVCKVGSEPDELGKNIAPIAISEKAELIYYVDMDSDEYNGTLGVLSSKDDVELAEDVDDLELIFNGDLTQLIYVEDETAYYSENGSSGSKLGKTVDYIVNMSVARDMGYTYSYWGTYIDFQVRTYGYLDFSDCMLIYFDDEKTTISILEDKEDANKIIRKCDDYALAGNGESVIYLEDETLFIVKDIMKGDHEEVMDLDEPVQIFLNQDATDIYYLNEDDELIYLKNGDEIEVADDVTYARMNMANDMLYMVIDEELHYSKSGSDAEELDLDEDISNFYFVYDNLLVVYEADSSESFYYKIKNDIEFEQIKD